MRYIKIPSDVLIINRQTGEALNNLDGTKRSPEKFTDFLRHPILDDVKWNVNHSYIRASVRIDRAIDEATDTIAIEETDWEKLRDICNAPTGGAFGGFTPLAMRQLCPFLDAVIEASDKHLQTVKSAAE